MKRWFAVWVGGLLFSSWMAAQSPKQPCDGSPPTHRIGRDGNVVPAYREWDPAQCAAAAPAPIVRSGAISARTLAHKPLRTARKEYDRGVHSWRSGARDQAVEHLAEAIRLDPAFVDAQNELGFLYVKTGRPELGLEYLERALTLEPNVPVLHTNKAAALVTLNRPTEAEQAARRALQLDPESIEANYMLGVALLAQDKISPEAATHLAVAAPKYPRAREYLARVRARLAGEESRR